jgi:hypothetical protein
MTLEEVMKAAEDIVAAKKVQLTREKSVLQGATFVCE